MRISDLEELVSEIRVLKLELIREKELRKKAESAWADLCELLGERTKTEEERNHYHLRVKAEVVLSDRLMLTTDANLGRLEEHLADTLSHALFLQIRSGRAGKNTWERIAIPRKLREMPVPEIPGSEIPE